MEPKMSNNYYQKEESSSHDDACIKRPTASSSWSLYACGNAFMSELWFTF